MDINFIDFVDEQYESEIFSEYRQWNQSIFNYFFDGKFQNKLIRLDINDEVIEAISAELKFDPKDFEDKFRSVIKKTLDDQDTFNPILKCMSPWSKAQYHQRNITPPFIAILAFFSYVAEGMTRDENFASSNFYGRLQDHLFVKNKNKMQNSFSKFDQVWKRLNSWLVEWEYALGIPTAYPLDFRVHISVPISQALIRDQDRKNLHRVFEYAEFNPGDEVSHDDMEEAITSYYSNIHHPGHILKLINKKDLKESALQAACEELETWDGILQSSDASSSENNSHQSARLFYIAKLESYPEEKIILNLCGSQSNCTCNFSIKIDKLPKTKQEIFKKYNGEMQFEDYKGYARLLANPTFSHGDALVTSLLFEDNDTKKICCSRKKKEITVLSEANELGVNWFKESASIQYGKNSLIIVWHSLKDKVDTFLKKVAKQGYEIHESSSLLNLPKNYVAFKNVQILNAIKEDGLEMLFPSGSSNHSINFSGGLYLLNKVWHANHPPEIEIISSTARDVEIKNNDNEVIFTGSLNNQKLIIDWKNIQLESGDYTLFIDDTQEKTLKLRQANDSRINKFILKLLGHHLSDKSILNGISATKEEDTDKSFFISGNSYEGGLEIYGDIKRKKINVTDINLNAALQTYYEEINKHTEISTLDDEVSFEKGDKIYFTKNTHSAAFGKIGVYDEVVKNIFENEDGHRVSYKEGSQIFRDTELRDFDLAEDQDSNLESISPKKRYNRFKHYDSQTNSFRNRSVNFLTLNINTFSVAKSNSQSIHLNEIFDGLCYLKEGTFETFCNIVDYFNQSKGFQYSLIKYLSSLGHIDIEYNLKSIKPHRWRISNPCVTSVGQRRFVLSGWRSSKFIESLKEQCEQIGGEVSIIKNEDMIDSIFIEKIDTSDIKDFAEIISESSNFPLSFSENFPLKLLSILPTLKDVGSNLNKVAMPDEDLDRAEINDGRITFKSIKNVSDKGAYRLTKFGVRYFFLTQDMPNNEAIRCDVKLAKYFAFHGCNKDWFAYNPDKLELIVPRDMDLPFLYERVVVSASGLLPEKRDNKLVYKNVSEEIAEGLAFKLFSEAI